MPKTPSTQPQAAARGSSFSLSPDDIHVDWEDARNYLGKGGFGIVYRGQYKSAPVAVKQLLIADLSDRQRAEFIQEAQMMASLHHPNIIQLYGFTESSPYQIVMEYMAQGSLYRVLHSDADCSWSQRTTWGIEIASGLHYLHTYHPVIIHRDLKSLNVLINGHHQAKLTDFGLALSKLRSTTATLSGGKQESEAGAVGTARWMAPELLSAKPKYSPASDLFAFAVVLWELAAREIPYADQSTDSIIQAAIKDGEREEIQMSWPDVFQFLIERCWDQKAEKRPGAQDAVAELQQGLEMIRASEARDRKSSVRVEKMSGSVAGMQLQQRRASVGNSPDFITKFIKEVNALAKLKRAPAAGPDFFAARPGAYKPVAAVRQQDAARAPVVDQVAVEQLLLHVARGEQDEAERMLTGNVALLLHPGKVTDYSNRTFQKITAFQYALWAFDWHMWTMLLKYLPQEAAQAQYEQFEKEGTQHGKHYNFQELTQALKTYVKEFCLWSWGQRNKYWCETVGGAQTRVVAHVANEYCHPARSFYPITPSFNDDVLPRSFNLCNGNKFYPLNKGSDAELGRNFAILRYNFRASDQEQVASMCRGSDVRRWVRSAGAWMGNTPEASDVLADLAAVTTLCKMRMTQYADLKRQLESAPHRRLGPA